MSSKYLNKIFKNEKMWSVIIPIVAGILLLIFAMMNLNSSIWFDESYSAYLVRGDFKQIWEMTAVDVHPPFFYFALKIWTMIFGTSIIAMRFMSVFFGMIAILFLFQLIKKWFGLKVASFATIAAAISPMFIRYSQEMRMYTIVLMLVMMATYFLTLALEKGTERSGCKYWVTYAILIAVGMWTHYFSAFMWITHLVIIFKYFGGIKRVFKDKKLLKTIILTYVFAVILYLPWLPSFFNQIKTVQAGFWIPPVSFETMGDFTASALFFNKGQEVTGWGVVFGLMLITVFVIGLTKILKVENTETKKKIKNMLILVGVPFVVMTALSLPPLTSSFVDRYILYSIVILWALFGVVAGLVKDQRLKIVLVSLVLIVAGFGISFVENRKPRGFIKEIIAETFASAKEDEAIIADGVWTYYDGIFYSNEKHPIYLFEEDVKYEYGSLEPIRNYRVNLVKSKQEFLENKKSVWYITSKIGDERGYKIPEWAEEMRVESEIVLDHHAAIKFTKD